MMSRGIKLLRFLFFLAVSFTIAAAVSTDVVALGCQASDTETICPDGYDEITSASGNIRACVLSGFDDDHIGQLVREDGDDYRVCVKNNVSPVSGDPRNAADDFYTDKGVCCRRGTVVIEARFWADVKKVCCDSAYSDSVDFNSGLSAADQNASINWNGNSFVKTVGRNGTDRESSCSDSAGNSIKAEGDYDPIQINSEVGEVGGKQVMIPRQPRWGCGADAGGIQRCRIDRPSGGQAVFSSNPRATFDNQTSCEQVGQETCFNHGSEHSIPDVNGETRYCSDGTWVTDRDQVVDANDATRGCVTINDDVERSNCFACVGQNVDGRDQFFVWNALGCWDVSLTGVVTRLFQIGVGIIGGVMILRFLQAAIMMQTDNPEQIREAREIIASAVIALVVLLGSVMILRFLGINVLGILPDDFGGTQVEQPTP